MEAKVHFDSSTPAGTAFAARVSRGIGALSLNASVQIIGQVVIVPVALLAWGKIRYGEWIVITGLVTFLKLTDLGLQTYVVNRLCASFACSERQRMERDLRNALRAQLPFVLLIATLVAAALITVPGAKILGLESISSSSFNLVAMLLAIELLIGVPMGIIAGVYRATGRLPRAAVVGAVQYSAITFFTIGLIVFSASFVTLALVRVAIAVIVSIWILLDLRKLYPWLRFWSGDADWREGARMIGPGLLFLMIPLADFVSTQLTLSILQGSADGGEVSRLATHRTVVNVAMMVSGLLTNSVWPELTALYARSESSQLRKAHRSLARLNLWLVGIVVLAMLPIILLIYPTWTARRLAIDGWTLGFLQVRMVIWGIWSASLTLLCAINKQRLVAITVFVAAATTGVVSVWLIPRMGMRGAALAQLIGDVVISAWLIPLLATRATGDSFPRFVWEAAQTLFVGILIPLALGLVAWRFIQSEVIRIFVIIPACLSLATTLIWRHLAAYERAHLVGLVKNRFAV